MRKHLHLPFLAMLVLVLSLATGTATAIAGQIEEFEVPGAKSFLESGITSGPDGAVWFTFANGNVSFIGKLTPSGQVASFPLPPGSTYIEGIAPGPDGEMWITASNGGTSHVIEKITQAGGVTEFAVPSTSYPGRIVSGPDGNLWFTDLGGEDVSRMTTEGQITEFPVPTTNGTPDAITVGPDRNVWFTETHGNKIARITPDGQITEFPLLPAPRNEGPRGITSSPDGKIWFTEFGREALASLSVDGTLTEFALPSASREQESITADRSGDLWFTEGDHEVIGMMTPKGRLTEFLLPRYSRPRGITLGSDGNIWFPVNGEDGPRVDRIQPSSPPPVPVASAAPVLRGKHDLAQRIGVSSGKWSGTPTAFVYEWERCDAGGEKCDPINDAHGQSYTLNTADLGHTIRVVVGAKNAAGTTYATTLPTGVIGRGPKPLSVAISSSMVQVRRGWAAFPLACHQGVPGSFCTGTVWIALCAQVRGSAEFPLLSGTAGMTHYRLKRGHRTSVHVRLREEVNSLLSQSRSRRIRACTKVSLWGGRTSRREVVLTRPTHA